jgi:hypothetical protein
MGPEVEKDKTIRRLWFEGGEGIDDDQITPFRIKLITAYIDWRDFRITPWDRSLPNDQIPVFWKMVLRNFRHLENDAQEYRREREAMKKKKPGSIGGQRQHPSKQVTTTQGGVAPTEELATQDYTAYRQKRIAQQHKQRAHRHQQLMQKKRLQEQQQQQQQSRKSNLFTAPPAPTTAAAPKRKRR